MKQLHRKKQEVKFCPFLFKLRDPDCFGVMIMQQYFPGLQEHIDRGQLATGSRVSGARQDGESLAPDGGSTVDPLRSVYKTVGH